MPRNENLRQERLAVTRAAVIGVSHPETCEAVKAVVVLRERTAAKRQKATLK